MQTAVTDKRLKGGKWQNGAKEERRVSGEQIAQQRNDIAQQASSIAQQVSNIEAQENTASIALEASGQITAAYATHNATLMLFSLRLFSLESRRVTMTSHSI